MLASDLNNPDFVGARNPDDLLYVEFYMHEPEDWNKSMEQGKMVRLPAIPYVRIQKPGDKTSIIETPVREDHKARWPQKWLYFQIKQGMISGDVDIPGWKIEEWDFLKPDQIHELKALRFHTVEQIAGASDDQVQRLGIGGLGMREQARQALRNKMGSEVKDEIAKKDAEIAALKKADEENKARLAKLEAALMNSPAQSPSAGAPGSGDHAAPDSLPKKRGRPKKVVEQPTG